MYFQLMYNHCAIFFDIEFYRQSRFLNDEENVLQMFIDLVIMFIKVYFRDDDTSIYYLTTDASNTRKYSEHIVFRIFQDETEIMFNELKDLKNFMIRFWDFFQFYVFDGHGKGQ